MTKETTETKAKFTNLIKEEKILSSLEKLAFTEATQVQTLAIPPAVEGKNLVVEAKTGSGKTLAFAIPMLVKLLSKIDQTKTDTPFALVVTPTRELALQIETVFNDLYSEIPPVTLIGGASYDKQKEQMKSDSRIIVGTPGRILDSVERGDLDLRKIDVFALDEADEMFSAGFSEDVEAIINETPEEAQGLFVSATISKRVLALAEKFLKDPHHVAASDFEEEPAQIKHLYCEVDDTVAAKPTALCDFLEVLQPESTIIFCNTKSETELVEKFMRRRGFNARRINSDLSQAQRTKVMEKIRANDLRYLIATDIAARGIDIAQIELVINFSIHAQAESYVHRTGRTGRAGRKGTALSLVSSHDFMGFQAVKGLDIELEKVSQPTDEEVAESQITHLKNTLTEETTERDLVLAKKILSSVGSDQTELEKLIASLASYTLGHLVSEEVSSLDEEMLNEAKKPRPTRQSGGQGGYQKNKNFKPKHNSNRR